MMLRMVFAVLFLASGVAAAAPAPAPASTGAMVARCKAAPDICKAVVLNEAAALEAKKDACIPKDLPKDRAAFRVMQTVEEVLEEVPGQYEDLDYTMIARQLMTFLWPCADKPIS